MQVLISTAQTSLSTVAGPLGKAAPNVMFQNINTEQSSTTRQGEFAVILRRALRLLTPQERVQAILLLVLMLITGLLESCVVAAVLPFVYLLIDSQRASSIPILTDLLRAANLTLANALPVLAACLILLIFFSFIFSWFATYLNERQTELSRNRMALELLERAIKAPYSWIRQQRVAVLASIIYDDVRIWRRDCLQSVMNAIQAVILIVFPAIAAILLAPLHGFYALAVLAFIAVVLMVVVRRPLQRLTEEARMRQKQSLALLHQTLSGIREVKTSNRANVFVSAFDQVHRINTSLILRVRVLATLPANMMTLLGQIGFVVTAVVLWSFGASSAEITGQIAIIGVVVSRVLPAANRLNAAITTLLRALPFVAGMLEVMDAAKADRGWLADQSADKQPLSRTWKTLEFSGVHFNYEGSDAGLSDVNLRLERGNFYGVVGRSGAGKSTLINLLLGLYGPTRGTILIDGIPRENTRSTDWLDHLAYIPQDVFILDDSLSANIIFGRDTKNPRSDMAAAVRAACLDEFLDVLPQGLDTPLGERGRRFSGGQAQRVAIARALYNAPSILLMDEATSALDSITEERVQQGIRALGDNVLVVSVAHRISSLRTCDAIIVMDSGRVVDVGTYGELLARNALFAELAARPDDVERIA